MKPSFSAEQYAKAYYKADDERNKLLEENERLRKALEFYADRDRYEPPISHIIDGEIYCNESEIEADFGRTAREALNNGD